MIYRTIGGMFGIDGEQVFALKTSSEIELEPDFTQDYDDKSIAFAQQLAALDQQHQNEGYKSELEGMDEGYGGNITHNADLSHFSINMHPTGG